MIGESVDIAVVGAGLSGLVCAVRIADSGARVIVLEARDRVGGRTLTTSLAGGLVDLGGQWITPGQDRVAALAAALGLERAPQRRDGRAVIDDGDRAVGWARSPLWSLLPLYGSIELAQRARALERMRRTIPIDAPERATNAALWDRMTLGDWLRRVRTRRAADTLTLVTELFFAAPADELSLLWAVHTLAATGGLSAGPELADGASEDRLAGGAQELSTKLARQLGPSVRLGCAVSFIAHDGVGCQVSASDGVALSTRAVVIAVPPPLVERIAFSPDLPAVRRRLQRAMGMGGVIKCNAAYDHAFWRDRGGSGEAYAAHGLVRAVVDVSPAGGPAVLQAFLVGNEARAASAMPSEARRAAVLAVLVRWFGPAAAVPIAWAEMDWLSDRHSAGCVGYLGQGHLGDGLAPLRAPVGRICFAGSETAVRWPRYLEGAVEAGERAAAEAMAML